jgi:hypothetical protein
VLGGAQARAGTHIWTGAVSALWSDAGNWTGGGPAADPAPDLVFGAGAAGFDCSSDLPGTTVVRSLQFTGGAYDLSAAGAGTLALQEGIGVSPGARARIAIPVSLSGNVTHDLVVSSGGSLELAGPVSGGGTDLLRPTGGGTVVLSADNVHAGATLVGTGGGAPDGVVVYVEGTQPASAVTVLAARLSGTGVIGPLTLDGGSLVGGGPGIVRPGGPTTTGVLRVQGDARLRAGEAGNLVQFRLTSPTDHDRLAVTGGVFLEAKAGPTPTRPTLDLVLGFVPSVGQTFTLVESTGPLTGTFENGADGTIFKAACLDFRINYTANSATVTRVAGSYEPFASFYTVPLCRVLDTREPAGPLGGPSLAAGGVRVFPVAGSCQIPTSAKALAANVTVAEPLASGNLRVVAGGNPLPLASVINFGAGQTRANNLVVGWACSPDKTVLILNESLGEAHVILDVNGYFE